MKVRNTYSDVIEGEENITNVSKELQGDMTSPTGSTAQRILGHQEDPSELIQRLTAAIQAGDGLGAASLAEELSNLKLKLDISVPNDDLGQQSKEKEFSVKVHVEDRVSEGCTFNLMVKASDTIQDLKNKVMIKYNFPVEVQRWIIGRKIPDNKDHLRQHGIKRAGHTLYLYLMTARSVGLNPQDYQAQREAILDGRNPLISNFYLSGTPSPLPRERPTEWPPTPSSPSDIHPQVYSNPSSPVPSPSPVFEMGELDHGQIQHTGPSRQASKRSLTSGSSLIHDMLSSSIGPPDNRPKSFNSDSGTSGLSGWAEGSQQDLGRSGRTGPRSRTPPRTPPPNIEDDETAGWECPACTYINLPTRPGCEICSGPRPSDYHVPDGYQMTPMELLMKENEQRTERMTREAQEMQALENYQNMLAVADQDLVANPEPFQCPICFDEIDVGEGIMLRECLHSFCRDCLIGAVQHCEDAILKCPYQDDLYSCDSILPEREIKALVPHDAYVRFLQRGLDQAESQTANSYHCKTADCPGWCIYEDLVNFFRCPVCGRENCLTCKAIHEGQNCKQYQDNLRVRAQNDVAARQTADMLQKLVADGDAMHCPQCQVIVQKKDGCDWIKCSICKTEICWVTKGRRWGPNGEGDYSGGCGCRRGGKKCHPRCMNCH